MVRVWAYERVQEEVRGAVPEQLRGERRRGDAPLRAATPRGWQACGERAAELTQLRRRERRERFAQPDVLVRVLESGFGFGCGSWFGFGFGSWLEGRG